MLVPVVFPPAALVYEKAEEMAALFRQRVGFRGSTGF